MSEVTLRPIIRENYGDALRLQVKPDQENFVSDNAKSLVQAAYETEMNPKPYGIYADETMVGFLMTAETDQHEALADALLVWRLMIDAAQQGNGYGKAAMHAIIEKAKTDTDYRSVVLSYEPENTVAQALYAGLGFVEEGIRHEWGGEMLARLTLIRE